MRKTICIVTCALAACGGDPAKPAQVVSAPAATSTAPAASSSAPAIASSAPSAAPASSGEYAVVVGVKEGHAQVGVTFPCLAGKCPPAATIVLGEADSAQLIGLLDLKGTDTWIGTDGHSSGLSQHIPADAAMPAAAIALSSEDGDRHTQRLTILSLADGHAAVVFSEGLSLHGGDGGGYSTINRIELKGATPGEPLAIDFAQTSTPGKSDRPFRPGPPLHRHYEMENGRYVRKH